MSGLIPPPAVPCLFGTQQPAPSQLSFTPAEYFIRPELSSDPCVLQVAREQGWRSGITAVKTPQSRRMTLNGDRGLGILDELSAWGGTQKTEGLSCGSSKLRSKKALLVLTAGTSPSFPIFRITPPLHLPPRAGF